MVLSENLCLVSLTAWNCKNYSVRAEAFSQDQAFECSLSSLRPKTQQQEGAACSGLLRICDMIQWNVPLACLSQKSEDEERKTTCAQGLATERGGRESEKWEQREHGHVRTSFSCATLLNWKAEQMNVKFFTGLINQSFSQG